ncbi:Kynureninase (L-kynurenine hydrolase) [Tilletia horrida]|nr:Kynureninase (L-kynurenine hydrolase) [Tilletia horrida]
MAKKKTTTTTAAKKATPAATSSSSGDSSHASLQIALLRCAALCIASKSTLRSNDLSPLSSTPFDEVPSHQQILHDVRSLLKRAGTTANALALALKVSASQATAAAAANAAKSESQSTSDSQTVPSTQPGPGSPLAGLDSASITAALAQLDTLTTDIIPKLVYVARKALKEKLVLNIPENQPPGAEQKQEWAGLGRAFAKSVANSVREVIESIDSLVECFMDLKTRAAMRASEQARYRKAVEEGEEESEAPPRAQNSAKMEDLTPAQLRKRALIRYDALYKLCERLADPSPPPDPALTAESYKNIIKRAAEEEEREGKAEAGGADQNVDRLDAFEVSMTIKSVDEFARGLPRDNWNALQREHLIKSEQLNDVVREVKQVIRWSESQGKEGAKSSESGPASKSKREDDEDDLDDLGIDDMFLDDEWTAADAERARRAIPIIENVRKVHNVIGRIFFEPGLRAEPESLGSGTFDMLSDDAEELLQTVDELMGYTIYAGDAVTEAKGIHADDEKEDDPEGWEAKEATRKETGEEAPYNPMVAEEIAEDSENLFCEQLIFFAQAGAALAEHGIGAVAPGSDVIDGLQQAANAIKEDCKKVVGEERWARYI